MPSSRTAYCDISNDMIAAGKLLEWMPIDPRFVNLNVYSVLALGRVGRSDVNHESAVRVALQVCARLAAQAMFAIHEP